MPTPTYTALANITLGSSASSVTFSSIPATYRDLVLVVNTPTLPFDSQLVLRFNGDTGSNYSRVYMETIFGGTGSAAGTDTFAYVGAYGPDQANLIVNIMDYSATDKHKSFLARGNGSTAAKATSLRWSNTAAITSILVKLESYSTNLPTGSTLNLFGIAS
jgi:hypothetical protein